MREYKFRAWDNEANLMIYSDHRNRKLYDAYYYFETDSKGELKCNWETEWTESCQPDGGVFNNLMQCTGIKDKNGVEIYEGDIVRTHFSFNQNVGQEPFIITWNKDKAMFEGVKPEKIKDDHLRRFSFFPEQEFIYEIVGNIYANAEMVKEKI